MSVIEQSQDTIIREIVLNTRKPVVLKNFKPNWKCFVRSIEEWCKQFDENVASGELVEFEQMPMKFGASPQWERYRNKIQLTLKEFLDTHFANDGMWTAFNYRRIDDVPPNCRDGIDFNCFGFPREADDLSFWLGSRGANTPCHYDTYGCNIVAQIYGRKNWILFPPETQLTPTRIPYEESSVYCLENFFSPKTIDSFKNVRENAYECTLDQGDVLIVPRNWWHYVESVETSLTVNSWIPLKIDVDAQIDECIVKYIIEKSVVGENLDDIKHILNPNQLEQITASKDVFKILQFLVEAKNVQGSEETEKYPYQYLKESDVTQLLNRLSCNATYLEKLEPSVFDRKMLINSKRYTDIPSDNEDRDRLQESLLNAIAHPQVIKIIKDIFLKTYSSNI